MGSNMVLKTVSTLGGGGGGGGGTVTAVTATSPVISSGGTAPNVSCLLYTSPSPRDRG